MLYSDNLDTMRWEYEEHDGPACGSSTGGGGHGLERGGSSSVQSGSPGTRGEWKQKKCCPACELGWRFTVPDAKPEWATEKAVQKDLKSQSKGVHWNTKGQVYRRSGELVQQALGAPGAQQVSQKERKRMTTARCKEMADQLTHVIKKGRLFKAFLSAGEDLKVSAELSAKLSKAYDDYLNDPDNKSNLERLEELEDEAAKQTEYKTAGGDVEILKALDYHNDMSEGFCLFDVCSRKCGNEYCGI